MIGMLLIVPGGTQAMYDKAMQNLGLTKDGGNWPEGVITHTAGPSGSDWVVVDTWESKEAIDKFFQERLGKAMKEAGIPPVEPKFFDVYLSHKA